MKISSSCSYILKALLINRPVKASGFGNESSIDFLKEIDSDLGENLALSFS